MTLYEANFIKLNAILRRQRLPEGDYCSVIADDCDLFLTIHEQTRYTSLFTLTYMFDAAGSDGGMPEADPDLRGRIYYDAKMVEVLSWIDTHQHQVLRQFSRSLTGKPEHIPVDAHGQLEARWKRNIMFSKWLEYLSDRGHAFSGP